MTSHDIGNTTPGGLTAPVSDDVVSALHSVLAHGERWEHLVRYDPIDRVRTRLHSDGYESWLLTWLPGQATTWHAHRGGGGAFVVIRGELTEEVSTYPSAVDLDSPDVTPAQVVVVPAPEYVSFPSRHLHRVVNRADVPAVSLHVIRLHPERQPSDEQLPAAEKPDAAATLEAAGLPSDDDDEPLLTPGEVAAYFRVHPKTITRWAESGRLNSVRTLGNHRRFRASEVRALRREHLE